MTKAKWDPDIKINEEIARKLIESQFKKLRPLSSITRLGSGWDNSVFLVNKNLVFRFPHRKVAACLIERENILLPKIYNKINLLIPELKFIGRPSVDYPYSFHGYKKIDGQSGCRAALSPNERKQSIKQLAEFLSKLHSFNLYDSFPAILHEQNFKRSDPKNLINSITYALENDKKYGYAFFNRVAFACEMANIRKIDLSKIPHVFLHGDLYCKHLIFENKKLAGIIDWGDCGGGFNSVDLAVIFTFYPQRFHEDFFSIYGEISPESLAYARFAGIHSAANITIFGKTIKDSNLFNEGLQALKEINPSLLN